MKDMENIPAMMAEIGARARAAAAELAFAPSEAKTRALNAAADAVWARREEIIAANARDMRDGRDELDTALLERLELNDKRLEQMAGNKKKR